MEFVDRQRELAFLSNHFDRPGAGLLVIWGRRRVGKTTLLQKFVEEQPVVYHAAVRTTPTDELRRLSARLAEFFDDDLIRVQPLVTWDALFAYLAGKKGRFGLVLDEFPYLVEASPELPTLLQQAWDNRLSKTGIKLILCGSSISMMERTLLAPSAPLFGRRTGQWKVQPFGPIEVGLLTGGTLVERVETYSVIGGIPMYAGLFDRRTDLATNIRERILTKGEVLFEEVPFLLRQELREPRVYQAILAAAAAGAHRFSELSSKTGLNRANLVRYLAQLEELELVRREIPVTEERPHKSRKGLYRIANPFVRFWYRYVYPNLDRLELQDAAGVLEEMILPDLHVFVATGVEPILTELFRTGPLKKTVPFRVIHAGRHWSRTEELDLVLFDQAREQVMIGEIKWSRKPVHPGLLVDLRRRVEAAKLFSGKRVTLALVSRTGFAPAPVPGAGERFVDLSAVEPTGS